MVYCLYLQILQPYYQYHFVNSTFYRVKLLNSHEKYRPDSHIFEEIPKRPNN